MISCSLYFLILFVLSHLYGIYGKDSLPHQSNIPRVNYLNTWIQFAYLSLYEGTSFMLEGKFPDTFSGISSGH